MKQRPNERKNARYTTHKMRKGKGKNSNILGSFENGREMSEHKAQTGNRKKKGMRRETGQREWERRGVNMKQTMRNDCMEVREVANVFERCGPPYVVGSLVALL